MRKREIKISAAAVLLMALFYYVLEPYEILALLLPAAVHELGHIISIKSLGLRIRDFRTELRGFCIEYYGSTGLFGHILIAASGPAAGFLYAYLGSVLALKYNSEFFSLSAGISLLLSLFNLLPVIPLDGGRIAAYLFILFLGDRRGARLAELISTALSLLLMCAGLYLMFKNRGAALLISSIWLLFYQENAKGIVKAREIL